MIKPEVKWRKRLASHKLNDITNFFFDSNFEEAKEKLYFTLSMFCQIHDAVEAAMAAGGEKSIAGSSSSSTSDLKRKGSTAHCFLTFDLLMQAQKRLQAQM